MKCQSKTLTWDVPSFLLLSFGSVGVIKAVDESLELSFSWIDWTSRETQKQRVRFYLLRLWESVPVSALGWAGLEAAFELVLVLQLYHSLQCLPRWLLSPDLIWD